jgi:ribosomal protein S27E
MARKADVRKVRDYERRRPERTLLYQLVAEHYPRFLALLATQGRSLPAYVQREFDDFLKCGILEHGFLRVRCQDCHDERLVAFSCKRRGFCPSCGARRMVESAALLVDEVLPRLPMRQWVLSFPFQLRFLFASRPEIMSRVLGLVYRAIETHLIQQAGCTRATAKTGAVTLIQRFGGALNLNIHFHMLFLDGVYLIDREPPVFRRLSAPRPQALEALIHTISQRVGAYLEREGLLVRDIENTYLQLEAPDESAINDLLGHSITYRIAVGPQAGRKAFTLQTVPAREQDSDNGNLAKTAGFSLHAGVAAKAHQRRKLERLCRYIARPAVATDRLALTRQGYVRYQLKTPYRDGTTHIILEPLDFIARLAALVPKPRVNLTRFHGVFAPNSALRHQVTPAGRGKQKPLEAKTPAGLGGRSRLSGDVSGVRRDVPRRCCMHRLLEAVALAYRLRLLGLRID